MKKYYKFIFMALFGLFVFVPFDTFAWSDITNVDLYRGYAIGMSDTEEQYVGNVTIPHTIINYVPSEDRFLYGIRTYMPINSQEYQKFTTLTVDITIAQDSINNSQNSINQNAFTGFAVFNTNNLPGNETCSVIDRTKSYTKWRCIASYDNYTTITGFNLRLGVLSNFETTLPLGSLTNAVVSDTGYHPYANNIYIKYMAYDLVTSADPNTQIIQDQLKEQEKTNQKLDETNKELGELNDNLTSEDAPDLDSLNDSAGWLNPGPVDSIINLPLSLFQNLTDNLSKSCQPVIVELPYVHENITLPCISTLYEQIGLQTFLNWVGIVVGALILYNYFLKLYQWVDDTLTFRENNWQDWGGV